MKVIFEHITKKSQSFTEHPLFVYLRDTRIDARERMQFVPAMSHFVMTFADLYHFFLTEPTPQDRYHELVNTHLSEEGTHWKWFLADLTNMGLDPTIPFTDALRYLWSDSTIKTRRLAYEICKMSAGLTSIEKLVLVQSIEATGRVGLEAAVPAGSEAALRIGKNLVYFGNHHLDTERQHTLEETDIHNSLESVVLDEPTTLKLLSIVDQVFMHFASFVDETLQIATARTALPGKHSHEWRAAAGAEA